MKAIVVTDQAAGTAGMTLVEQPDPKPAINDVVVQVHASGFVPTEMAWPSTWTDHADRDRTPSIPGHELAGLVTALGYGTTGLSVGQRVFGLTDWHRDGTLAEYVAVEARRPGAASGRRRLHGGREPADLGPDGMARAVRARPPSGGAERPCARRGRRSRDDGDATGGASSAPTSSAPDSAADRQKALDFGAQEFVDLDNDVAGRRRRSRPGFRCHRRRHPACGPRA